MDNLESAADYVTQKDLALIGFTDVPAVSGTLRAFGRRVALSPVARLRTDRFPAAGIMRAGILLALAAVKGPNVFNAQMYGFSVTVRGPESYKANRYVYVDGIEMIHVCECWDGDADWSVLHLNPAILSGDCAGAVEAVLRVCTAYC